MYSMTSLIAGIAYRCLAWSAPTRFPYPASVDGRLPKQTPPISFPILIYSHRGGNRECDVNGRPFLENTLPAFQRSAIIGVDLLELDVQLTRDGKAAVFHDRELGRMCGPAFNGKRIADFDYVDLPPLLPPASGDSKGEQIPISPDAVRIPLLEEVMASHPGIPIQIDLKVYSLQLVSVVNDLVSRHGRERQVLWGSFIHSTSNALYAVNPHVPLFTSAPRALLLLAAHSAGRLHEVHLYESAVILPWRMGAGSGANRPSILGWWRPSFLLPSFFQALNARGVSVVLYGDINDETAFEACMGAGANAICTDSPSRFMRWLAARRGAPGPGGQGAGGGGGGGESGPEGSGRAGSAQGGGT